MLGEWETAWLEMCVRGIGFDRYENKNEVLNAATEPFYRNVEALLSVVRTVCDGYIEGRKFERAEIAAHLVLLR